MATLMIKHVLFWTSYPRVRVKSKQCQLYDTGRSSVSPLQNFEFSFSLDFYSYLNFHHMDAVFSLLVDPPL